MWTSVIHVGPWSEGSEGHYVKQSNTMVTESGQKRRRKGE